MNLNTQDLKLVCSFLYILSKKKHFKNYEKLFLFPLKSFFVLEMLSILPLFYSFQIQRVGPKKEFF